MSEDGLLTQRSPTLMVDPTRRHRRRPRPARRAAPGAAVVERSDDQPSTATARAERATACAELGRCVVGSRPRMLRPIRRGVQGCRGCRGCSYSYPLVYGHVKGKGLETAAPSAPLVAKVLAEDLTRGATGATRWPVTAPPGPRRARCRPTRGCAPGALDHLHGVVRPKVLVEPHVRYGQPSRLVAPRPIAPVQRRANDPRLRVEDALLGDEAADAVQLRPVLIAGSHDRFRRGEPATLDDPTQPGDRPEEEARQFGRGGELRGQLWVKPGLREPRGPWG